MGLSLVTRQAYSEIDEFLSLLSEEKRNEIPIKLREFFKEEKDKEYKKGINPEIPIKEQELKEETLGIIAMLNLQYWCKDENQKARLKKVYAENENKYQEILREKYNPDDIFKKKEKDTNFENKETINNQIIEYKEPLFKKIINEILMFFHLK